MSTPRVEELLHNATRNNDEQLCSNFSLNLLLNQAAAGLELLEPGAAEARH